MRKLIYGGSLLLILSALVIGVLNRPASTIELVKDTVQAVVRAEPEQYTLLFTGDIMLARVVESKIRQSGDWRHPFLKIADVTAAADLTIGNLEGPISSRGKNQGSIYSFRMDPRVIEGLQYAGFDILSLANNHIWDWGRVALLDTITLLDEAGIKTAGAGANQVQANAPAIKTLPDGTQIAFLSYTNLYPASLAAGPDWPGVSRYDSEEMNSSVAAAAQNTDIVVVLLHWGEEYQSVSNKYQQNIAHQLIGSGADLIIGHHPHVAQEVEKYSNGWIAYSLGNFVFDQDFSEATMRGLMAEATVQGGEITDFKTIATRLTNTFQPFVENTE